MDESTPFGASEPPSREIDSFKRRLLEHLVHTVGKDQATTTGRDWYNALARTVRDLLVEMWMDSTRSTYRGDVKRVYYLSLEFLIGRSLMNNLLNTGFLEIARKSLADLGLDLDAISEEEPEAALGNGGLGRLAACFIDSMATLGIAGYGYGIRYDYGMFAQEIEDGWQTELPDHWLYNGNPWEFSRPEVVYPVRFYGHVESEVDANGRVKYLWKDTEEIMAMAHDQPVPGFGAWTVNNTRLWAAKSSRVFDLKRFNQGDYLGSVRQQGESENLSRVLYPDDSTSMGKELRLKQEYFFVCAALKDILRRFKSHHDTWADLPHKVAIQLNDTHPSLAVPEMMRLLMDKYDLDWDDAWNLSRRVFSYTNHTLLPEALETWPVALFETMLPRHLMIIYEINRRFLEDVRRRFPGDEALVSRVSLIGEDHGRRVRMAHIAFVGSHAVNGVARIHTELMKTTIFADFYKLFPDRIVNKTNGVTPRRWVNQANRGLAGLVAGHVDENWPANLEEFRKLVPLSEDKAFRKRFLAVKLANKQRLARLIESKLKIKVNADSLFDVHVKRIHEYKRQLLNVLGVIARYNRLKDGGKKAKNMAPRTVILAGKAAPGYHMAKLIIKLIHDVGKVVNADPATNGRLKLIFLPNYNVALAEKIIPAADLSQQISTAGTEASGTGNMKLALNGALTIGTRDGANIEMAEEVGEENFFFFGLTSDEVMERREPGHYDPRQVIASNPELARVLAMLDEGVFSGGDRERFRPLYDSLVHHGDWYLLCADFADYMAAQDRVDKLWSDQEEWAQKAILNVARMGRFSSDVTIMDYAKDIWDVAPHRPAPGLGAALSD
ncbi:MAG: glycogen/starch/alpha-glucan phosphorylase [Alphaproteobacteria bacterium]|nr:glycogen/starch/alpha-glucan phosphorylase [Alphaproteobacteria bacterium]